MEEEKPAGIKIVDNRMFDQQGNPRQATSTVEISDSLENKKVVTESAKQDKTANKSESEVDQPKVDFSSFIMSFATQALMQLGEIAPPEGMDIKKDIQGAHATIDLLDMIKEKTKGNLEEFEDNLLKEILHNLHIAFVRASKR
ncbi:MAG: DUF1844 domain-containing protein [Bdellovibrionales bacterium]|nr:DUF1844 domain-containing protein [Bdellovibrionales bacterium]